MKDYQGHFKGLHRVQRGFPGTLQIIFCELQVDCRAFQGVSEISGAFQGL